MTFGKRMRRGTLLNQQVVGNIGDTEQEEEEEAAEEEMTGDSMPKFYPALLLGESVSNWSHPFHCLVSHP